MHAEIMAKQMGVTDGNATVTLVVEEKPNEGDEVVLDAVQTTMYRVLVARANYLGQDRFGIAYAVKEMSRGVAKPTEGGRGGRVKG